MIIQQLKNFLQLLLNITISIVTVCFVLWSFIQHAGAAVAPNEQYGKCGPYYLWYQIGPDSLMYSGDYVDLCEITFDISEVYKDFDFVYFTGKWTYLDKNRDGISDQDFYFPPTSTPTPTSRTIRPQPRPTSIPQPQSPILPPPPTPILIKWKPEHGCVRIHLRDCWGTAFNENCGYAMISIQPKPGVRNGSARIPIKVTKKCPPSGVDCSETAVILHSFSDCFTSPTPDFIIQKQVTPFLATSLTSYYGSNNAEFKYTIIVQNTGQEKGDTVLTDTITNGTNGGTLELSELKIDKCPPYASCSIVSASDEKIQISFVGLRIMDDPVTITYTLRGNSNEVPVGEVSYFTNTATLSTGGSSQVTVGLRGAGNFPHRRPERPR